MPEKTSIFGMRFFAIGVAAFVVSGACPTICGSTICQPELGSRNVGILKVDGFRFKDLDKNGVLDPYEDWRLPVDARVGDLISRMSVEEKVGLMLTAALQGFIGPNGIVLDNRLALKVRGVELPPPPSAREAVTKRNIRWIFIRAQDPPEMAARGANAVQEMAESTPLGIPVVLCSDPRHSMERGTVPVTSVWPDQIGLAAIGDPEVVREFAHIAKQEYRAQGLRVTISPVADLATEPRWSRIAGTFGEDVSMDSILTAKYVEGFQGPSIGPDSVLCATKHFPGDGPVKDGIDPHVPYGRWQVYPGNRFGDHLEPFRAAIDAGTAIIMPGYGIPVGIDSVGMNFSKAIVTDLLRRKLGYDGIVMTDFLKDMPWGVEDLSETERQHRIIDAGCDQIGGEDDPQYLLALARSGAISTSRMDESVRRVLRVMFQLGLFENPYVDPGVAAKLVANPEFIRAGQSAMTKSIVLIKNDKGLLPLASGKKVYVENMNREIAAKYGQIVDDVNMADVAIIKVEAPYALHQFPAGDAPKGFIGELFAKRLHEGTLAYSGAENASELDAIRRLVASGKPVVVCMYMDRPAILTEFIDEVGGILAHFNSNDRALLDIIFGRQAPSGRLPFDLPRDMASVLKHKPDLAFDIENPLFRTGFGLSY